VTFVTIFEYDISIFISNTAASLCVMVIQQDEKKLTGYATTRFFKKNFFNVFKALELKRFKSLGCYAVSIDKHFSAFRK
jgi:hypothetical protein